MDIFGRTKVFGIIGCPVKHSLSPLMQNAAFKAMGLDSVYVPFPVSSSEALKVAVDGLRALGVAGFNVTIPFKELILPYLDVLDDSAVLAGAVNTVVIVDNKMIGYNTDGDGFVRSLACDLDYVPGPSQIVILGAGGAARGAVTALCTKGANKIVLVNRTSNKASRLADYVFNLFPDVDISIRSSITELNDSLKETDLLVNTTSVGMNNDEFDSLNVAILPTHAKVYDMVYSPPQTPLLQKSNDAKLRAVNGLGMLAAQGELAFQIWTGMLPPEGLMRGVLSSVGPV